MVEIWRAAPPLQGHRGADVRARRRQLGRQGGRRHPQRPLQERPIQGARPGLEVCDISESRLYESEI